MSVIILWSREAETLKLKHVDDQVSELFGGLCKDWIDFSDDATNPIVPEDRDRVQTFWSNSPQELHNSSIEYKAFNSDRKVFGIRETVRYSDQTESGGVLWGSLQKLDCEEAGGVDKKSTSKLIEEKAIAVCSRVLNDGDIGLMVLRSMSTDDPESLVIVHVNQSASIHTGLNMEQATGVRLLDRFPNLKNTEVPKVYTDVIKTQTPARLPDQVYGDQEMDEKVYRLRAFPITSDSLGVAFENITQLVAERNQMQRIVDERTEQLKQIERSIALKYAFSEALVGGHEVDRAYEHILKVGCEILGFDLGVLWIVNDQQLHCAMTWGLTELESGEKQHDFQQSSSSAPSSLVREVQSSGKARWVSKETIANHSGPLPDGMSHLSTGLIFPIKDPLSAPIGIIEFYSRKPKNHDPVTLSIVRELSGHIADNIGRRAAQNALFETEAQYALLAQTLSDVILTIDEQGTIVFANPATQRIFGYAPEAMIGQNLTMIMPVAYRDLHRKGFQRYLKTGIKALNWLGFEIQALHESGNEFPTSISLGEYQAGGKRYVTAIIRDISSLRQRELELEKTKELALESARLKSEFLANTSHEIRTPMNGVVGMTGLLLGTELDEEQTEYAEAIQTSARNLLTVINDVLDFSSLESGKLRVEKTNFSLNKAIQEIVNLLTNQFETTQVDLKITVTDEVPDLLRSDPARLWQVLMNLMSNALKFTDSGFVELVVSLVESNKDSCTLKFEVKDSGIGISEVDQRRLFQPFSQVDGSQNRRHQGTGLGLVISRQIVELVHGSLGVESQQGSGSNFWFTWPFELPETEGANAQESERNHHLLLVDDDSVNLRMVFSQLADSRFRLQTASSAAQAWSLLKSSNENDNPIELILISSELADQSWVEFVSKLRASGSYRNIKVVLILAGDNPDPREKTPELKLSGRLRKPISSKALQTLLEDAFSTINQRLSQPTHSAHESSESDSVPQDFSDEFGHIRVLIAEDNPINRRIISLQLKQMGLESDAVNNGQEVLNITEGIPYQLILMDCQMPILGGYEASTRLRQRPDGDKPVILALTAHALEGERERCLAAGMDEFLAKPLAAHDLRKALAQWLPEAVRRHQDL